MKEVKVNGTEVALTLNDVKLLRAALQQMAAGTKGSQIIKTLNELDYKLYQLQMHMEVS